MNKPVDPPKKKSGGKINDPVNKCPIKEEVETEIIVFDEESSGNRYFNEKNGLIQIAHPGDKDKVTIHYSGPNPQSKLQVTKDGKAIDDLAGRQGGGGQLYELELNYDPATNPYQGMSGKYKQTGVALSAAHYGVYILKKLMTHTHQPTKYQVTGLDKTINVHAYNPDLWKFSVKFPSFKQKKFGVKFESSEQRKRPNSKKKVKHVDVTVESSSSNWQSTSKETIESNYQKRKKRYKHKGTKTSNETESVNAISSISLVRNGEDVETGFEFLEGVLKLRQNIDLFISTFKNLVPKVGWYIDFELKVMEGSIDYVWGWKEDENYQVFYYKGLAINATIFEIMLEVGFGVSVSSVAAQICVNFKGGVSSKFAIENKGPLTEKKTLATFTGNIEVGGYLRLKAGELLKIEGGIKTGLTVDVTLDSFDGGGKSHIEMNAATKWDGLVVVAVATTFFGSKKKTFKLIDEKQLGKTNLFGEKPAIVKELKTKFDVANIVKISLQEGYDLRVFKELISYEKSFFTGKLEKEVDHERVSHDDVALIIADAIWKYKDKIHLDNKAIEGLCHSIRSDCDKIAKKTLRRDWMTESQLRSYLYNGNFKTYIHNLEDDIKKLRKEMANRTTA